MACTGLGDILPLIQFPREAEVRKILTVVACVFRCWLNFDSVGTVLNIRWQGARAATATEKSIGKNRED